jgi:hypothetical protein
MNVGAVGGSNPYTSIATGQRINSSAMDPKGSEIAKGMEAKNAKLPQNINTNEAAVYESTATEGLSQKAENTLQRLKELALQANKGEARTEKVQVEKQDTTQEVADQKKNQGIQQYKMQTQLMSSLNNNQKPGMVLDFKL